MSIRIYTARTSQVAKEAAKLASAIATFKFERDGDITRAQSDALSHAQKALAEIINKQML